MKNLLGFVQLPVSDVKVVAYDKGRGGFEVIVFRNGQRSSSRSFHTMNDTSKQVSAARAKADRFCIEALIDCGVDVCK